MTYNNYNTLDSWVANRGEQVHSVHRHIHEHTNQKWGLPPCCHFLCYVFGESPLWSHRQSPMGPIWVLLCYGAAAERTEWEDVPVKVPPPETGLISVVWNYFQVRPTDIVNLQFAMSAKQHNKYGSGILALFFLHLSWSCSYFAQTVFTFGKPCCIYVCIQCGITIKLGTMCYSKIGDMLCSYLTVLVQKACIYRYRVISVSEIKSWGILDIGRKVNIQHP